MIDNLYLTQMSPCFFYEIVKISLFLGPFSVILHHGSEIVAPICTYYASKWRLAAPLSYGITFGWFHQFSLTALCDLVHVPEQRGDAMG